MGGRGSAGSAAISAALAMRQVASAAAATHVFTDDGAYSQAVVLSAQIANRLSELEKVDADIAYCREYVVQLFSCCYKAAFLLVQLAPS